MALFAEFQGVKGQSTDKGHKDWVVADSMSSPIMRSIPAGAKDNQRTQGDTVPGDVVLVRTLDKSSVKLQEGCANGTFYEKVTLDLCAQIGNKQETFLQYVLHDVIITSYSIHANGSGDPLPSEEITLGYSKVEWTYTELDPKTGDKKGNVPGKFDPGLGAA